MHEDRAACLAAIEGHDARFDGWFFTGVTTTGIYCRPSCPVRPPRPDHVRFFPTAASAQQAGFRACKRCRPDASPGSPEWATRTDVVARAMRLIAEGVVDREGVAGLAGRLGYGTRQLQRHLLAELGVGPLAVARAQRAQTARILIETTRLPMAEVAAGAGFASVRSFNDTVRTVFASTPTQLRARAPHPAPGGPGALHLRLAHRTPLNPDNLFGHLAATSVPGVEEWRGGAYRRTLRLPHGAAVVSLRPGDGVVHAELSLADLQDLAVAISRCRALLDLDADPEAVDARLAEDPTLATLVAAAPGRRVPGTVDPDELAVRTVLGQQVSTAAARTHAGRLVLAHGRPVADPGGGLTHLFPSPDDLAALDPETLALPRARRRTLLGLVDALARGAIDLSAGADRAEARARLAALPGFGPWSVEVIAMRALGDPDAFCATDLGVVAAARRLGLAPSPAALARASSRWRPWRAYAVQHLWATGDHAVNHLPSEPASA